MESSKEENSYGLSIFSYAIWFVFCVLVTCAASFAYYKFPLWQGYAFCMVVSISFCQIIYYVGNTKLHKGMIKDIWKFAKLAHKDARFAEEAALSLVQKEKDRLLYCATPPPHREFSVLFDLYTRRCQDIVALLEEKTELLLENQQLKEESKGLIELTISLQKQKDVKTN